MFTEVLKQYHYYLKSHPQLSKDQERVLALENFEKMGFPNKKWEEWRYASTKTLDRSFKLTHQRKKVGPFQRSHNEIVIECHNGFFDIETQKQTLKSLGISISEIGSIEKESFLKKNKHKHETFLNFNEALYENGIYIKVASTCVLEKPLIFQFFFNDEIEMINPLIFIELEEGAQIKIHEIIDYKKNSDLFINTQMQVKLLKNANLKYFKLLNPKKEHSILSQSYFDLAENSSVEYLTVGIGSDFCREHAFFNLNGRNSECRILGFSALNNGRKKDDFICVSHNSEETKSSQFFKSILQNKSHYVFQGQIKIEQVAQRSSAEQLNKNLLLDQQSHVDTKPQLDVKADDVKASHGATIGQLDLDEKFYLLSRAIPPQKVFELLCGGYSSDVVETSTDRFSKEKAKDFISKSLKDFISGS